MAVSSPVWWRFALGCFFLVTLGRAKSHDCLLNAECAVTCNSGDRALNFIVMWCKKADVLGDSAEGHLTLSNDIK